MKAGELSHLERTRGALRLHFALREGATVPSETYQSGALRVRFPHPEPGQPLEAALINTAGGLTGGDRLTLTVGLAANAQAVLSSQACEKIYRSAGGDTSVDINLTLGPGASLHWLPQPTILFDGARLRRKTCVEMDSQAEMILLESCVLGRAAMGEEMHEGRIFDSWRIRRDGRLVYADTLALEGAIGQRYARDWALGPYRAFANLVCVAPYIAEKVESMRALLGGVKGLAAASAWNGLLSVRLMAGDSRSLIAGITHVLSGFRGMPLPRLWAI